MKKTIAISGNINSVFESNQDNVIRFENVTVADGNEKLLDVVKKSFESIISENNLPLENINCILLNVFCNEDIALGELNEALELLEFIQGETTQSTNIIWKVEIENANISTERSALKLIWQGIKNLFSKRLLKVELVVLKSDNRQNLKIIGIGGFGLRAVNYLKDLDFNDDELFVVDTDAIDLKQSKVPYLQIGEKTTRGIGSGTKSQVGENAVMENYDSISKVVTNAKTIVMILSSGGATGTGAAPIIAKIAKEHDVRTIAIVTGSFILNNKRRKNEKTDCIEKLQEIADKVVTIAEDELIDLSKIDRNFSYTEAMKITNNEVYKTIKNLITN